MSYFIHNKYSAASIAAKEDLEGDVTVIDYYGLLESDDTTYKNVDTSVMGQEIAELAYVTIIDDDQISKEEEVNEGSEFHFETSIIINQTLVGSVVKQTRSDQTEYNNCTTITLPVTINPDKCIVFMDAVNKNASNGYWAMVDTRVCLVSLTSTQLTCITGGTANTTNIFYRILEFK